MALEKKSKFMGGFDSNLLILPFDHRSTFKEKLFGYSGNLTPSQKTNVANAKQIVFQAFLLASKKVPSLRKQGGILVDEEFGSKILLECKKKKIIFAIPVEKSGQEEFQFEYGKNWKNHLLKFKPTFAKALVRLNPGGDEALNSRQLSRLAQLSKFCHEHSIKLMFELLVAPTKSQLNECHSSLSFFDKNLRPILEVIAIRQIQNAGVSVDVWKIEGVDKKSDFQKIVRQAKVDNPKVGVIVLGRGEDESKVFEWLKIGKKTQGVIGFAVGRTVFWNALKDFKEDNATRVETIEKICDNYLKLVSMWNKEN